jgi:hypothetical protein
LNNGRIILHHEIPHVHCHHCPPFADISFTFRGIPCGVCDCDDFLFARCLQENNFQFLKDCFSPVDFDEQVSIAESSIDQQRRKPNNDLRKFLNIFFMALDFSALEKGERRKLPNCAVAKVRQIYPSDTGSYMGFKVKTCI